MADPGAGELQQRLTERFGDRVRACVPLAPLTTFGIGGPADLLVAVLTEAELVAAVQCARAARQPVLVLGGGSNVLLDDAGRRGLTVLDRTAGLASDGTTVTAASGTATAHLALATARAGLAGLEFAGGIYGTVGGAVRGNAGAYGCGVGDRLQAARLLAPDGSIVEAGRDWFAFAYRTSRLAQDRGYTLLSATFALAAGDAGALQQAILDDRARRLAQHPAHCGCAGSFFRNLPPAPGSDRRQAAGELLDRAGCKGLRTGAAAVFAGHANFVINLGGATAAEVQQVAAQAAARVQQQFGVVLQREVEYPGTD